MGFLSRVKRGAPQASTTADQLERILLGAYGNPSASGVTVTPDRAMKVATVFACVRALSEDVAKLPIVLYRRTSDGGKERAIKHRLYPLLHDRPNSWQTSFEFREMMQGHLALRGNAYAFVNRVGNDVRELLPIHPDRVTPKQDGNWNITYQVQTGPQRTDIQPFEPSQILHLRGLSSDGLVGLSPVGMAREAIGLSVAAEEHGGRHFSNGAKPGLVAKHPGRLTDAAAKRLKESIEGAISGENIFRLLLLEEGMDATAVGINHADAQFLETRAFQREDIASFFRMPPHKVGILARSTNNNIEQQAREYLTDTLQPWLERWAQRLTLDLLTPAERLTHFFEFKTEALLKGDTASRFSAYAVAITNGWMSRNEVRIAENMNPKDGLDEFLEPLNMDSAANRRGEDAEAA